MKKIKVYKYDEELDKYVPKYYYETKEWEEREVNIQNFLTMYNYNKRR